MNQLLKKSELHRILFIPPGRSPRLLFPRERCLTPSITEIIGTISGAFGIFLIGSGTAILGTCLLVLGVLLWILHFRFETVEQKARSRIRHNKCIRCGELLVGSSQRTCDECVL